MLAGARIEIAINRIVSAFQCEEHNIKAVNTQKKLNMIKLSKVFEKCFDLRENILF